MITTELRHISSFCGESIAPYCPCLKATSEGLIRTLADSKYNCRLRRSNHAWDLSERILSPQIIPHRLREGKGRAGCCGLPPAPEPSGAVYLPQRGVDVEEEGAVDVVAPHLPEVGFIPAGKDNHRTQP